MNDLKTIVEHSFIHSFIHAFMEDGIWPNYSTCWVPKAGITLLWIYIHFTSQSDTIKYVTCSFFLFLFLADLAVQQL